MFGTQTRVLVLALVLCSVATNATTSIIKAEFVESRADKPNATTKGTLYYYYDDSNSDNCRLYMEYSLPGGYIIKNLYYYSENAMYSMCSGTCTGLRITESPDPWYYNNKVYDKGQTIDASHRWYNRKAVPVESTYSAQVKSIAMGAATQAHADIQKIIFEDGRTLTLSKVELNPTGIDKNNAMFKKVEGCPKPTCPIYADLVFVLDNSGSVNDDEWKKTTDFVNAVMDSFTFGIDAVEAAIIQFNAPFDNQNCPTKQVDNCNQCSGDFGFQMYYYIKINGNWEYRDVLFPDFCTAEVIAGTDQGKGITVSTDRAALQNTLNNGGRPDMIGNTCQGYGLELAMKVLDHSPRNDYTKKPNRIVISVTDGADMCPNRTADAAAKLQKKSKDGGYEAFVIEIGVGMSTGCNNYDRKFLERIASKVGSSTTPAYYPVDNYDAIHEVTEKLFKPLCDDFNTECGPDCHGFCGCGKCYCPDCTTPTSTCEQNTCRADNSHATATGCVNDVKPCPIKDDVCTTYKCDGTKPDADRCTGIPNPCTQMKSNNPGTCREVLCSTTKTGGCYVNLKHSMCQSKFGNACVDFECTPEGESVDLSLYEGTGCRPKAGTNKTAIKEQELINSGKSTCFRATCNANGVTGEEDTCTPAIPSCYTSACTKVGDKKYKCVDTEKKHPANTACETYICDNKEGWIVDDKNHLDEKRCIDQFEKEEEGSTKCQKVYCDANEGCQMEKIPQCDDKCSNENVTTCISRGAQLSTVTQCILGTCIIVDDGGELSHADCDFTASVANCVKDLANEIAELNENYPERCYNPACSETGKCTKVYDPVPADMPETKCMKAVCTKDANTGMWEWKYKPTETNTTCKSDACSYRFCDPDHGCNETDICKVKTNECVSYSCDVTGEVPVCKETNATFIETECTEEICDDGKKVLSQKNVTEVCNPPNKCYEPFCQDGVCNYTEKIAPDDDPCVIYTCNPETGEFDKTPKCDDGLYCTENQCTIFGECKYQPISCVDQLDMSGYPCFEPRCKEVPDEKKYKCVRKLIRNAYIDVCGRCIQESTATSSETSSSTSSFVIKGGDVDTTGCTGAPAKPILTEGLAAASIALIIIAAVVVGAAITASSVMGTKTLLNRAKGAENQSAHSNPLFEGNETELSNPMYTGNM